MSAANVDITLADLKLLLSDSIELNIRGNKPRPYRPDDFSTTRSVRLVEHDGFAMVVIYGTHVSAVEAETTTLVARHTSVRVPTVYALFTETEPTPISSSPFPLDAPAPRTMTYIVEERLLGRPLNEAWPTLTHSERAAVARDLRSVFAQLSALVPGKFCLGPLRGPWQNAYFRPFEDRFPCGDIDARTPRDFLGYFRVIALSADPCSDYCSGEDALGLRTDSVDLMRRAVFSHGNLHPANVLVTLDGRVAGVVGWANAGWWPYFWDSFVLQSSAARSWGMHGWEQVVPTLCEWVPEEAHEFRALYWAALEAL